MFLSTAELFGFPPFAAHRAASLGRLREDFTIRMSNKPFGSYGNQGVKKQLRKHFLKTSA